MLDIVKMALRLSTEAYDSELEAKIASAKADLQLSGVVLPEHPENDSLITMAVVTYVRMHFGAPENYSQLKASYDEQKAQLQSATEYQG